MNVWDIPANQTPEVKKYLKTVNQTNCQLIGKIKYLDVKGWTEHKIKDIDSIVFAEKVYEFIESIVKQY